MLSKISIGAGYAIIHPLTLSDMNNTKISPKFRNEWSIQPLSHVYWLVAWGIPSVRAVEILNGIVVQRSNDSLMSIVQKTKSWITSGQKVIKSTGVTLSLAKRLEKASKIPARDEILRYKAEGKGFIPVSRNRNNKSHKPIIPTSPIQFLPDPENPFANQPVDGGKKTGQIRVMGSDGPVRKDPPSYPVMEAHEDVSSYVDRIPKPTATVPLTEAKELMVLAKEMGATEIEYKGMKIKF